MEARARAKCCGESGLSRGLSRLNTHRESCVCAYDF